MYAQLLREVATKIAGSRPLAELDGSEREHQARSEAEDIVCHALQMTRLDLLQRLSETPADSVVQDVENLVFRRCSGEPLAYVLGNAYFFGRSFATRPGCLIPRPDTETLVDVAIRWIASHRPDAGIVDVGTGSGCIAVTLALECPRAQVTAVDISQDALAIARENATAHQAKVTFVHTDAMVWLRSLIGQPSKPSVIVSNPPYITKAEMAHLDDSVVHYEPVLALYGGADGLDFYRGFASLTPAVLNDGPNGLFFEVGSNQAPDVAELFLTPRWKDFCVDLHCDLRGVKRVVAVTR